MRACVWVVSHIRYMTILVLIIAQTSCATDAAGPSDRLLLGTWGSADAELIAIQAGAEVRFGCTTIVIERAIDLRADNTFVTRGRLQGPGAVLRQPVVDVTGSLSNAGVSLRLPIVAEGEPMTFMLAPGVARVPNEVPECPL